MKVEIDGGISDQRIFWEEEYLKPQTFEKIHSVRPSTPVPSFAFQIAQDCFWKQEINVADMGCGKGRNSIYLATEHQFKVLGLDFSLAAVRVASERLAVSNSLKNGGSATFVVADLSQQWPLEDGTRDAVVDCNTTICIPSSGRENAIAEGCRVLKKGGLYLFYGVARTGWVDEYPGPEPNSTIFPDSGKFEKQYEKNELLQTFGRHGFSLVELANMRVGDKVSGVEMQFPMMAAVFRKK